MRTTINHKNPVPAPKIIKLVCTRGSRRFNLTKGKSYKVVGAIQDIGGEKFVWVISNNGQEKNVRLDRFKQ